MHFFRKYRGIPVFSLSLSKVRPSSEYGVLWRGSFIVENSRRGTVCRGKKTEPDSTENSFNKDESVANCDGAKLLHRDEAVPVSHLDCTAVSLFFRILSLFFFCFFGLLSFFLFFLFFFDLPHHGTGKGKRETAA
jgi:hypothetical protein